MAIVTTDNRHYKNIADAIRATGIYEGPIPPSQMAELIGEFHQCANQIGKQEEYNRFWDAFQQNGNRTAYNYAFGGVGWTSETFKPKYNMIPARSDGMFHTTDIEGDLVAILASCGVTLDLSACTTVAQTYAYADQITRLGIQDTRASASVNMMFFNCNKMVTIDKLILKDDGSQNVGNTFAGCTALENLVIQGKIGQSGFNVSWSVSLTHSSLISIINALLDLSGTGTTLTATLGTTNLAKLTDAEKAVATQKGWTLA